MILDFSEKDILYDIYNEDVLDADLSHHYSFLKQLECAKAYVCGVFNPPCGVYSTQITE